MASDVSDVREREVLTVEQAAEMLQLHKATVYKYIREGVVPAVRIGKSYRILRRDLDALFQAPAPTMEGIAGL